jgi:hypothetical protein
MTQAQLTPKPTETRRYWLRGRWLGWLPGLLVLLAAGLFGLNQVWPYRYRNVKPTLESVFASNIEVNRYHRTYFPNPGFVADGLVLRRRSALDLPPVGSVEQIRVEGRWMDLLLLRNRIARVTADGLHLVIPPVGSKANREDFPAGSSGDFTGPATLIQQLVLRRAVLDILRVNGGRYRFPIERLVIGDLGKGTRMSYAVEMENAIPSGKIQAQGSFGPLLANQLGATPVTGAFRFTDVHLRDMQGLNGTLAGHGHFGGTLADIVVSAAADVPDFAVLNGQKTTLSGTTTSTVDALNGDVRLQSVDLMVGRSAVHVEGAVAGSPKQADVEIAVERGRTEDLVRPFMQRESPLAGAFEMHSHAHLAPAAPGVSFLDRLTMEGGFKAPAERLTDPTTEQELTDFSGRAQAKQNASPGTVSRGPVSSSVGAQVAVKGGLAHISRLQFTVPGAALSLDGVFNLVNQGVKLTGNLTMQTDLSHVTTGWRSWLLKLVAPFFRRKDAGTVLPVVVSGAHGHYNVGQDVIH